MPIYEYKCQKCDHKFEKLVFGEEETKCPKCNSKKIEKLLPSSINVGKGGSANLGSCSTGTCPFVK